MNVEELSRRATPCVLSQEANAPHHYWCGVHQEWTSDGKSCGEGDRLASEAEGRAEAPVAFRGEIVEVGDVDGEPCVRIRVSQDDARKCGALILRTVDVTLASVEETS